MVMELGLHTREVTQRLLESNQERVDAANIICTIVTLDRQWSAATGLPAHFKESMFDPDLLSLVRLSCLFSERYIKRPICEPN